MSNSVRPHRWQPTRLPRPWDSPGKNTGAGCHFLLRCMEVKSEKWKWSRSVVSDSLWPHGLQPTRLLHPWDFPGKSAGVGCHCLLRVNMRVVLYINWNVTNYHTLWGFKQPRLKGHTLLSHSFCGSGVWAWPNWVLCLGAYKSTFKGSDRLNSHLEARLRKNVLPNA